MSGIADVALRFASDEDLLSFESKLDNGFGGGIWPRTDAKGNAIRSWDRYHQKAMNQLARTLRAKRDVSEPLELGRLDPRSKDRLREPAACIALHFLFVDADNSGDATGFCARKAADYWTLGNQMLNAESVQLDYDSDNNGTIDELEKNQPFPTRFIRG